MKLKNIQNSRSYRRAAERAQLFAEDSAALESFTDKAMAKALRHKSGALRDVWDSLMGLLRLIKAYSVGEYRDISWQTLALIVSAVVYFIMPIDAIPDVLLGWGFLDDIGILTWVMASSKTEIDKFKAWETKQAPATITDLDEV